VAAAGELSWPSAGRFVSVYGEDLMAADTPPETCRLVGVGHHKDASSDTCRDNRTQGLLRTRLVNQLGHHLQ
jgi:hypothetical protein